MNLKTAKDNQCAILELITNLIKGSLREEIEVTAYDALQEAYDNISSLTFSEPDTDKVEN